MLRPNSIGDPTKYKTIPVIVEEINLLSKRKQQKYSKLISSLHATLKKAELIEDKSFRSYVKFLIRDSYIRNILDKKDSIRLEKDLCAYVKAKIDLEYDKPHPDGNSRKRWKLRKKELSLSS